MVMSIYEKTLYLQRLLYSLQTKKFSDSPHDAKWLVKRGFEDCETCIDSAIEELHNILTLKGFSPLEIPGVKK